MAMERMILRKDEGEMKEIGKKKAGARNLGEFLFSDL